MGGVRALLVLAMFVATVGPVRGDDSKPGARPANLAAAADAARAACAAGDSAKLAAIARGHEWPVWMIADLLAERGDKAAALALAHADDGPANAALPAYLESRKPTPDDAKRRAAFDESAALIDQRKFDETLAAVDRMGPLGDDVLSVRAHRVRAMALAGLGREKEARASALAGAEVAERIGWLTRAALMIGETASSVIDAEGPEAAIPLAEKSAALFERCGGDGHDQAASLGILARAQFVRGDMEKATTTFERAVALATPAGDVNQLAVLTFNLALATSQCRGPAAGALILERAVELRRRTPDRPGLARALSELGNLRSMLGDREKAIATFEEARSLCGTGPGWTSVRADLLFKQGFMYTRDGEPKKAAEVEREALAAATDAGDRKLVLRVKVGLGSALHTLGDYRAAHDLFEEVVPEFRRLKDRVNLSESLRNLSVATTALGDARGALPQVEEAVRIAHEDGSRMSEAVGLVQLGVVQAELGDEARGEETMGRALSIQREIGDRGGEVSTLVSLGARRRERDDLNAAIPLLEQAAQAGRAAGRGTDVGHALSLLGLAWFTFGDFGKARAAHEEALAVHEAQANPEFICNDLLNLAATEIHAGRYVRAQALCERALGIAESRGDKVRMGIALGTLANVEDVAGRRERRLDLQRRALKLYEEAGDEKGQSITLGNMTRTLSAAGAYDEALACARRSVEIAEKRADRRDLADSLRALARAASSAGRKDEALDVLDRATKLADQIPDRVIAARALADAGNIRVDGEDAAGALPLFERSKALFAETGDRSGEFGALEGLARCHMYLGRPRDAIAEARQAIATELAMFSGLGDEAAAASRSSITSTADVGWDAAVRAQDPGEGLFFFETARAGALLEAMQSRAAMSEALLPPALLEAERVARSRQAASAFALRRARDSGDAAAFEAAQKALAAALDDRQTVLEKMQRAAKSAGDLVARVANLDELRAALRPDEAMVHYRLTKRAGGALLTTSKGARFVEFGEGAPIRDSIAALDAGADADPADVVARLRALLVDPLALGAEVKRVLISPDTDVPPIPFCLLFGDREVVHVPSATVYLLLRDDSTSKGDGVLALGDPAYDVKTPVAEPVAVRGAERLLPLPGTRAEAKAVGSTVLLGAEATEANLRDALAKRRWRAVHLACHGLVDAEHPGLSSLAVTPTAEDDGFLSVLDVFRMKAPADLVVLSACHTGQGRVARGEGVLGLTRAFMFAGAPRVIVSGWKVDDAATLALMTKFYELWNPKDGSGKPAATALREAQAFVRAQEKWKHSKYWAAWALWGLGD